MWVKLKVRFSIKLTEILTGQRLSDQLVRFLERETLETLEN